MGIKRKKELLICIICAIILIFSFNHPQFTLFINGIESMQGIELKMSYILNVCVIVISTAILLKGKKRVGIILAFILFTMIVLQLYYYGLKIFYV